MMKKRGLRRSSGLSGLDGVRAVACGRHSWNSKQPRKELKVYTQPAHIPLSLSLTRFFTFSPNPPLVIIFFSIIIIICPLPHSHPDSPTFQWNAVEKLRPRLNIWGLHVVLSGACSCCTAAPALRDHRVIQVPLAREERGKGALVGV